MFIPKIALDIGYGGCDHRLRFNFMDWLTARVIKKTDIVLDLGCVNGGRTATYSHLCKKIIGIDSSRAYLTERVQKENVHYLLGNWDFAPIKSKAIDVVIYDNGLEHSKNIGITLSEIDRICSREILFGVPHAPDVLLNIPGPGHLTEFTHDSMESIIKTKFRVLESYFIRHSYTGYNWIVIRAFNGLNIKDVIY